jgi:hypothetical protein
MVGIYMIVCITANISRNMAYSGFTGCDDTFMCFFENAVVVRFIRVLLCLFCLKKNPP